MNPGQSIDAIYEHIEKGSFGLAKNLLIELMTFESAVAKLDSADIKIGAAASLAVSLYIRLDYHSGDTKASGDKLQYVYEQLESRREQLSSNICFDLVHLHVTSRMYFLSGHSLATSILVYSDKLLELSVSIDPLSEKFAEDQLLRLKNHYDR